MEIISNKEFADFLANKPLYNKIIAVRNLKDYKSSAFIDHTDFKDKVFKFMCPEEKAEQTFKTAFAEGAHPMIFTMLRDDPEKRPYTFNTNTDKLDFKIHLQGVCQSCSAKIDFLIRTTSDKEWNIRNEGITITLQKIGQFPSYDIKLNDNLKKYLNSEDQINYSKALTCLSISYGIGSFAYFRRIIENEIKRIIQDISELEFDGVQIVKDALSAFQIDFQMSKLIETLNIHLPLSLKELGDNPIKLLYQQLSGGIHEFTEDECIEKAQSIDILLNYVIRKINEEKYQLDDVKIAMQKLRKKNS